MNATRMTLRRVEPIPAAKLLGGFYAILGLFIGALASLAFLLGDLLGIGSAAGTQAVPRVFALLFGAGSIVLFPIIYGVTGFLAAFIGCLIYNGLAGWLGGIQWDVQITTDYAGFTVSPVGTPPPIA
jgi:hypothetical protein